ncbi:MAG: LuxR C-terminal-related transcriptional regulator [Candidatus Acidiferrales bacterium]
MDQKPVKSGTKILVSCSNRILTEAIARMVSKKSEFDVVATKASGPDDFSEMAATDADVLVLDSLEIFLSATANEDGAAPSGKPGCVLVAMEDNHIHFLKAIQNGVRGYVLRDASALEVICAIRCVSQGQAACPPAYTRVLFDYVAAASVKAPSQAGTVNWELTRREQQLIPLISRGLTNKEIANTLNLSEQTVKNHIHRMMRKMQSANRLDVCNAWQRQCASSSTTGFGYSEAQESV